MTQAHRDLSLVSEIVVVVLEVVRTHDVSVEGACIADNPLF